MCCLRKGAALFDEVTTENGRPDADGLHSGSRGLSL